MNKLTIVLITCLFSFSPSFAQWKETKHNFSTLAICVRPNPLWFWNDTFVESNELISQMKLCKEAGYGGLSILPFGEKFKPTYLSEDYFDVYGLCIKEAEKLGLTLWLYDEFGFPSGTGGGHSGDRIGRFKERFPNHTMKRLNKTEYVPKEKDLFQLTLPDGLLMTIVAMDTTTFERIDLQKILQEIIWLGKFRTWELLQI